MLIQNVTDQPIGWDGVEFPPGVAVEVDDSIGEVMMERHPQKFCPPYVEPEARPARSRGRRGQGQDADSAAQDESGADAKD